jgi:hypothetical protein
MPSLSSIRRLKWWLRPGIFSIYVTSGKGSPGDSFNNIGDQSSCPFDYFQTNRPVYRHDIMALSGARLLWKCPNPLIVGGGGLFFFSHEMSLMLAKSKQPIVYWGIGQNTHTADGMGGNFQISEQVKLAGLRDWDGRGEWGPKYDWVPCVSCMAPEFTQFSAATPEHDVVIYEHKEFPVPIQGPPRMTNNAHSLATVLKFLSSGRHVITSTFHGAYWSQLLGRKVLTFPFSNKFDRFRYPTLTTNAQDWRQHLALAPAYPEALPMSREANLKFAEKVANTLNIDLTLIPRPGPSLTPKSNT